ncbi:MAG TPA: hypothetical protein VGC66_12045 [Pyrinomonadaceae bacterium]|jgi:hypothetical protein
MRLNEPKQDKRMKVTIKKLNIISSLEIKNEGMELEVHDPNRKPPHLGDIVLTDTHVIWCRGKTTPAKGKKLTWEKFIELMQRQ